MTTAPRPDVGTLVIVQRVQEGGPVAVELACRCVLAYGRWLRESRARSLQTSDILSVTKAHADGVMTQPSSGISESQASLYFLYGEPTLEQACEAHGGG
jgi:hypothetical protein